MYKNITEDMKLCILTIIKNEQEYLDEFIKYHLDLGIDHIFIAEDYGSDSHQEITNKYPKDKVTLISVLDFYDTEEKKQRIIYEKTHFFKMQRNYLINGMKYLKKYHNDFNWCFVIDIDEYITLNDTTKNIKEILQEFNDYDAVILEWQNYGANGLIYKPSYKEKGIIETYTQKTGFQKSDENIWFQKIKTTYNLQTYNNTLASDRLPRKDSKWCKTNFEQNKEIQCFDKIYLRHYITKSFEEYVTKIQIRGMFFPQHRNIEAFFDMNQKLIPKKEQLMKLAEEIVKNNQNRT